MFFNRKFEKVKVVACRMKEAIIFDESIKQKYKYLYFPGMCPCIGVIIKDKDNLACMAAIHYLGGTNPESVLTFIKKYFSFSQNIEITTFAGNAPLEFDIPKDFPEISLTSPDIKNNKLPTLESTEFMSDADYYNVALKNRYEFNYILKALKTMGWNLSHIHNNTVNFGDNVFFDFKTEQLSTNLQVEVTRDDHTAKDLKNIFFDPDEALRDNLYGRLYSWWNGWNNIVVTDKRSWVQYGNDIKTVALSSLVI